MRRIGLFGGTFDPPHVGHLAIAEWARERLGLEQVVFMPTGVPPHKRARRLTPARHRMAMTRLAVRGNRAFKVSTLEARRRGASYTVDTLRAMAAPGTRLYLLIGEDSLEAFHTWREPERILELAILAVAPRPSASGREARRDRSLGLTRRRATLRRVTWLDSPLILVSSSQIRSRARAGRSVRYLVPDRVAEYIAKRRLYRGKA